MPEIFFNLHEDERKSCTFDIPKDNTVIMLTIKEVSYDVYDILRNGERAEAKTIIDNNI